jgi:hypothetical protein
MRQVGIVVAAAVLAATVGACASPHYGHRTYAYSSDYYYPNYYYSSPSYYSSRPVYYGSTWDYYRNYRGIHSSPELSAM